MIVRVPCPGAAAPLVGTLTPAPPLPPGTPTAIVCHGLASHRDARVVTAVAAGLQAAGVATLRLDFGGNGASAGARPFRYGNCREEAGDVGAAAAAVRAAGGVVVAAVGHSKGASSVLLHGAGLGHTTRLADGDGVAPVPPAAATLVNIAGRFDHAAGVADRFGADVAARLAAAGDAGERVVWRMGAAGEATAWTLTRRDLADRVSTDMGAACAALPPSARVLHVHGTADATVPPAAAPAFHAATAARCAESRLVLVEGGDHTFSDDAHLGRVVAAVVDFVVAGLDRA